MRKLACVVVLATVVVGVSSLPAGARPFRCDAVTFIGARGSGETDRGHDGVGVAVDEMARVMRGRLARRGIGMSIQYVHYPADSVNDFLPSKWEILLERANGPAFLAYYYTHNVSKFLRSIAQGVRDGTARVRRAARSCPSSSIVLAGYSQGAMVTHQVEQQLASAGTAGAALDRVAATLLLADGDRVAHSSARLLGTALRRGEGIRPWFYGTPPLRPLMQGYVAGDVPLPARTINICDAQDFICDFNAGRLKGIGAAKHGFAVHTGYAKRTGHGYRFAPQLPRAARIAAGWVTQARRARRTRACRPPALGPTTFPTIFALRTRRTSCAVARQVGRGIQSYWKGHSALPATVSAGGRSFRCRYRHVVKAPLTDYKVARCTSGAALVTMGLGS